VPRLCRLLPKANANDLTSIQRVHPICRARERSRSGSFARRSSCEPLPATQDRAGETGRVPPQPTASVVAPWTYDDRACSTYSRRRSARIGSNSAWECAERLARFITAQLDSCAALDRQRSHAAAVSLQRCSPRPSNSAGMRSPHRRRTGNPGPRRSKTNRRCRCGRTPSPRWAG
jgi:hypothetical protein